MGPAVPHQVRIGRHEPNEEEERKKDANRESGLIVPAAVFSGAAGDLGTVLSTAAFHTSRRGRTSSRYQRACRADTADVCGRTTGISSVYSLRVRQSLFFTSNTRFQGRNTNHGVNFDKN
ncbi:hypothetical protein GWI33_015746 [Rhynchophorus ferrugineus]|uniref:Uncharacterized protein n=1 Tax=Rhynchophorus ferrugineus TaxID=354439 RepID=A0A834M468_RHYFE|nr:hypothetical protein GWI33_015746 [Rhynchophorus ferrugineus]